MSKKSKLMDDAIHPERLHKLASGKIKPKDQNDEIFLIAYINGVSGEIFQNTLLELAPILDSLDMEGVYYIMLGYAMGQKDKDSLEVDFNFDPPSEDNKDKKIH